MKYPRSRRSITVCFLALLLDATMACSQGYDTNQSISDGAQTHQIAFNGLAFLTGNFCSCTFIPPGKVADYFGFQYLRDNDVTRMGHNTDFSGVIANNLLSVLDSSQKAQIVALAIQQVPLIQQYGYERFPLIDAFVRLRDNNIPAGCTGLDSDAVKTYSAQLYRLDGRISLQRAQLYSTIINSLTTQQRHYLDSIAPIGMANMPVLSDQVDKRPLNNNQFVAVMSFADDIFAWYAGNVAADVYFCPERQGNYFGSFFMKDAPAMGNTNYSIDTNLSQHGGELFLDALNPSQALLITGLVDSQRADLYAVVARRTDISNLLRGCLSNTTVDTNAVLGLSETYGQFDGQISYYYATYFSEVGWSLTNAQRDTLDSIRSFNRFPCIGAYLYSDSIGTPGIMNTDFLFKRVEGISENKKEEVKVYPNPAMNKLTVILPKSGGETLIKVIDTAGKSILETRSTTIDISSLPPGIYFVRIQASGYSVNKKIIINR